MSERDVVRPRITAPAPERERCCPRDEVPLEPHREPGPVRSTRLEVCPRCRGLFLYRHELARISGNFWLEGNLRAKVRFLRDEAGMDTASVLRCPACAGVMDRAEAGPVEVELCRLCRGLWLDRAELEEVRHLAPAVPRAGVRWEGLEGFLAFLRGLFDGVFI